MLAIRQTAFIRSYNLSVRWISKEVTAVKPNEIAKYIDSTENPQDTLNINWHQMSKSHKQYLQNTLKQNEAINKNHIDHITLSNIDHLTNKDALDLIEWIRIILASPTSKIRHLNIDLSQTNNICKQTNGAIIDSECINNICLGITQNPNKFITLESLEFHSVPLNTENVQSIFDSIKLKCRYCEYLSLENCNLHSREHLDIIYNFYFDDDYYSLRNTSLSEIDLYGNRWKGSLFFYNHPLVSLNRKIKKFMRFAIKSYGDFLRVESICIHTNDPYFRFCIMPNLRMTVGTFSREYTSYFWDVVRFNRRSVSEETIRYWRKMAAIVWFALFGGILVSDIVMRGRRSWWFIAAKMVDGEDTIKEEKRDVYPIKKKK